MEEQNFDFFVFRISWFFLTFSMLTSSSWIKVCEKKNSVASILTSRCLPRYLSWTNCFRHAFAFRISSRRLKNTDKLFKWRVDYLHDYFDCYEISIVIISAALKPKMVFMQNVTLRRANLRLSVTGKYNRKCDPLANTRDALRNFWQKVAVLNKISLERSGDVTQVTAKFRSCQNILGFENLFCSKYHPFSLNTTKIRRNLTKHALITFAQYCTQITENKSK